MSWLMALAGSAACMTSVGGAPEDVSQDPDPSPVGDGSGAGQRDGESPSDGRSNPDTRGEDGGDAPRFDAGATVGADAGSGATTHDASAPEPEAAILVGAGDIAYCDAEFDEATADLLDAIPGTIFTVGDNAYQDGTTEEFEQCFGPTWGRHKSRIRPSVGNHEYHTDRAAPYYAYFGDAAGPAGKGYYSYELGTWHVIALNTNIGMDAKSEQAAWLREDLAAHDTECTVAYMHAPRFSSGDHGDTLGVKDLWQILYDAGVDVVLAGHDHHYERFAPQDPDGEADPNGIREFVVGTGGKTLRTASGQANTEVVEHDTYGVLKLELLDGSYSWEFIPIAGSTFTDSGMGNCR